MPSCCFADTSEGHSHEHHPLCVNMTVVLWLLKVEAMEAELATELEREARARDAARRGREEAGEDGEEPDQAVEDAGDTAPPALVSAQADVLGAEAAAPASQRWGPRLLSRPCFLSYIADFVHCACTCALFSRQMSKPLDC